MYKRQNYAYQLNQTAANVNGTLNGNQVTYASIYPFVDARFTQFADGRHLDYILQSKKAIGNAPQGVSDVAFSEVVTLPKGWTWQLSASSQDISIFDGAGIVRMIYTTPYIYEQNFAGADVEAGATASSGSISGKYEVEQNGNEITIYTLVDYAWLTDASRNYPVVAVSYTHLVLMVEFHLQCILHE